MALEAIVPLRVWVEAELLKDGQPTALTDSLVLERLKQALTEMRERCEEAPEAEALVAYKHLRFLQHVLCEPPTVAGILGNAFQVPTAEIMDWLQDEPKDPAAVDVAQRVLSHLCDLCGEPEDCQDVAVKPPLRSFDELTFLGGLRHVFRQLYGNSQPKLAQAQYLPLVLDRLRQRFTGHGHGRTLVVAPTNGGKNGIILGAALAAVAWDQGPVLVLQPYRAQISESVRSWTNAVVGTPIRRRKTGTVSSLRVAGSSAVISDSDHDILRGRIDVTAIIPEKLAVLSRNKPLPTFCRLLVADEIGQLLTPERGPKLEIMLTLAQEADIGVLATGAAVSEHAATRIARWLGHLESEEDPRTAGPLLFDPALKRDPPIEYWVWRRDGKRRFWRDGIGPFDSTEADTDSLPDYEEDAVAEVVRRELIASPARQILVFVENRQRVLEFADTIARLLRDNAVEHLLSKAANDQHDPPLADIWLGGPLPSQVDIEAILAQRVGVHSRDVPSNNLQRIEEAFRQGRLRVLCATTTVEAGINLPVDTVIQVGLLDHNGTRLGQRALEQRLGRSGRTLLGKNQPGKGIIYVHDAKQRIDRVIQDRVLQQDDLAESQLSEQYRALLLLTYIGTANDKSTRDLERVLGRSYWAQRHSEREVALATDKAVQLLRQEHLAETIPNLPDSVWTATPLGQALSAALLLPRDAEAINHIVAVAEQSPADSAWLPDVLLAACQVPSLLTAARRPREEDVVARPPMTANAVLKSWTREDHGRLSFGFPRRPRRMVGGAPLDDLLRRCVGGHLRGLEGRALLRTYAAWLWATGEAIDVKSYVRNLTDHILQQDLAYYLSHVLRAAAWLAQYRGRSIISLRLKELSRVVDYGVPPQALPFYEVCGEHLERARVGEVQGADYGALLAGLNSDRLAEDLRLRLEARRHARHHRELWAARSAGVVENEDQEVRFDRMKTASDAADLLNRALDPSGGLCSVLSPTRIKIAALTVEFAPALLIDAYTSDADLVVSAAPLPEALQWSRQAQHVSLLGSEEFVVLVSQLCGRSWAEQCTVLTVLARLKRVCYRDLIDALTAEVAGVWSTTAKGDALYRAFRAGDSADADADIVDDLVRALGPLFGGKIGGTGIAGRQVGSSVTSESERQEAQILYCVGEIRDAIRQQVNDRRITLAKGGRLLAPVEAELELWHRRGQTCLMLIRRIEDRAVDRSAIIADVNALGRECMAERWTDIIVGREESR